MATFEQAVQLLANKPTPAFLATNSEVFYAGLQDLASRVAVLEHASLEATFKVANLEDAQNKTAQVMSNVEVEHADNKKRLAAIEAAPASDAKKLDAMDKRVRTVEGAVGSSTFKKALLVPATAKLDTPKIDEPKSDQKPFVPITPSMPVTPAPTHA